MKQGVKSIFPRRLVSLAMVLLLAAGLPLSVFAAEYDLAQGSVTVSATESGQTVTHGSHDPVGDDAPVIIQSNSEIPTANTITITAGDGASACVTLDSVNINTGGAAITTTGKGDVTIELDGSSTVQSGQDSAGVHKENGGTLTITNTDETTAGDPGSLNATGGYNGAGIGGGKEKSGSDIVITGNADVTANGGYYAAGIGGGYKGSGSNITIEGSAIVDASGGFSGAGIGGGLGQSGSGITISDDAQVQVQGGTAVSCGTGAAIGDGGNSNGYYPDYEPVNGSEIAPDTRQLDSGWIAAYSPGSNMNEVLPESVTYRDDSGNVQTSTENITKVDAADATCTQAGHTAGFACGNRVFVNEVSATGHSFTNYVPNRDATYETDGAKTAQCDHCTATDTIPDSDSKLTKPEEKTALEGTQPVALYRVTGKDGRAMACKTIREDGTLTIAAEANYATLSGTLSGIKALTGQGIDTIVFITNGASSAFALSDLLAKGEANDTYALTHDGSTVSFTLGHSDIRSILA